MHRQTKKGLLFGIAICNFAAPSTVLAAGVPTAGLPEVVITGSLVNLQGTPLSASEGVVTEEQLSLRPVLRTGELLEVVPGLVVTQHSGDGKANQYFLRGFNLDHGTDLATSVEGVPVNMPTHAHGQGYTDLNFVIPELIRQIEYRKGTYYAETGNFSAAGAVSMHYKSKLDQPFATLEIGRNNYRRGLLAVAPTLGAGTLLAAVEYSTNDGPWVLKEDYRKVNGLLKYSVDFDDGRLSIAAQGYDGHWRSTDQIPLRAVQSGLIDRFGYVDPTDGGESDRYSLAIDGVKTIASTQLRANLYAVDYKLDLFSNFTYALDQVHGDQFEQLDQRRIYGGEASIARPFALGRFESSLEAGLQWRRDAIGKVALYHTEARERFETVREDAVLQSSYSLYASVDSHIGERFKAIVGARVDRFDFAVNSSLAANSGSSEATLVSPKLALVFGPWNETEFFANIGRGFHSNDARGTTITVDPTDGVTPVDRVDPLVKALGYDLGARTALIANTQLSVSLWRLQLDSELVFSGDAGSTEPSRRSDRRGVEIGMIYNPLAWLIVDADLALSRARFTDDDPVGQEIPNAVERVASIGVELRHPNGLRGGLRLRHFGDAPLIEDNSVRSAATTVVNLEVGYEPQKNWKASVSMFNVFNRRDNDITYFYESQLKGEPYPVSDIHFHPVEPRTVRGSVRYSF